MEEKLLMRNEVDQSLTWDLSLVYKTEELYLQDLEKLKNLGQTISETYQGKLDNPVSINQCLETYREAFEIIMKLDAYANLATEVDYYDTAAQVRASQLANTLNEFETKLSFMDSEILSQSDEVLNEALNQADKCKGYLKELIRNKPHTLSKEVEEAIATVSQSFDTPYTIYNSLKLGDMKFDDFEVDGKKYPLGYSLFEDSYEYNTDTAVRRKAFEAFSKKIRQYENGTAAAYNAYCTNQLSNSKLRKYENIFEPDLFADHVTREMYDRQIDLIMEHLAPVMQKWAKLIKEEYKLDKMTYADLKLSIDPEFVPTITIEQSREYITKGLSIMGQEYVDMINEAYDNRWVDFAKNQGKSTGGFCSSPYGLDNSYILLSWNDLMADVFTLAHELGHAGHFRACNRAQSIFDTNVAGYFVEAPSTMNEILMSHYMLKTNNDPRFRRWVLANMISKTYYHNFVTHLLEAAYQREVYYLIEKGESVNAEILNKTYKSILEKFWGDSVELIEGSELTWMRQPHYYMGLYSYSYSAGLTIATQMCKRIENEGDNAVEDWKNVLKAGSTLDPIGLASLAKIDITNSNALIDTIKTIESYVDEIIELTAQLNQ